MAAFYRVSFQLANNEDLRQAFVLTDTAEAPLSLAGAVLKMDIEVLSGSDVLEVSTENGRIVVTDAAAGKFELAVPAATMRTLPEGLYQHDLLLTSSDGHVRRVWSGTLSLSRGVTE